MTIAELLADEEELVESLPTELHHKASLLINRLELSELLDLVGHLPTRQIGTFIEFLKPLVQQFEEEGEEAPASDKG